MEKTNNKISNAELVELVKGLPQVAKRDSWVFSLDRDEDSLFYSPAVIPAGAELHQVTDEFAVYLGRQRQLQGVMSEYFTHNFIKHHEDMQRLVDKVFIDREAIDEVDPQKEKGDDVTVFKGLFEKTLIAEACCADLHS